MTTGEAASGSPCTPLYAKMRPGWRTHAGGVATGIALLLAAALALELSRCGATGGPDA